MVFFSVDVFFNLKDISNSEPLQHKCTFFRLLIFKTELPLLSIKDNL